MHNHIKTCSDFDTSVYVATEQSLSDWTSEDNLQFPHLVSLVGKSLSMDVTEHTEIDPIVRRYVRTHPEWRVSRGAKGGIMRLSVWQKKQGAKDALDAAKKAVKAQVEAKVKGSALAQPSTLDVTAQADDSEVTE